MKIAVKTQKYVRVVGYYAPSDRLNKGKTQEFADRKVYQ